MSRSVLLAGLLLGCASSPPIAWHGRSPSGAHRAQIVVAAEGQRLVVDDREVGTFERVEVGLLAWSPRGPVVPVRDGGAWRVLDGRELGPPHRAIGALEADRGRVIYAALGESGWRLWIGGEPGPAFESIRAGSLVVARRHVAYVGRDAAGEHAVIDSMVGPAFARVDGLGFAGKGRLAAYAGYDDEGSRLVIDGEPGPVVEDVIALALAPDEPRWAALIQRDARLVVLHDGDELGEQEGAADLVISRDGARVAWVRRRGERDTLVVDGEARASHERIEALRFVPPRSELVYVARSQRGSRVADPEGRLGPRFDAIDPPLANASGHWGYVGHRAGAGSAVVIDGELRFRGEWAGQLRLAARGAGWAFVARHAAGRRVVTPEGSTAVPRPLVDTLVLSDDGERWGIAVADRRARVLRVLVDGAPVARLDLDEVAAELERGREVAEVTRGIVARHLSGAAGGGPSP